MFEYFKLKISLINPVVRQRVMLWAVIFIVVILIIFLIDRLRVTPVFNYQQKKPEFIQVKLDKDDEQSWEVASEKQLTALSQAQSHVAYKEEKQSDALKNISNILKSQREALSGLQSDVASLAKALHRQEQRTEQSQKLYRNVQNNLAEHMRQSAHASSKASFNRDVAGSINSRKQKQGLVALKFQSLHEGQAIGKSTASKKLLGWLPLGSFFKATLLHGIDAGTGAHTQSNPQPVLMRVTSQAWLPNFSRYILKDCFVLGSAYGSLSTERVYIRTARLSCVNSKGDTVVASKLSGYIVDSDGKLGLRGHLINKQGIKLAKATLSGFLGGVSQGVHQLSATVEKNDAGRGEAGNAGSFSLRGAGLSGMYQASQELAHFYLAEAKRLFPVIEIYAGREVTINVSRGISLLWQGLG